MAKQTKKISAYTEVTTVSSTQKIPLADGNGGVTRISLENLKKAILGGMDLNAMEDGVFIMFHRNLDNYPLMVKPYKWTSYQNNGEIAEGVVVVEGGKMLVVAPTETTLTWSSAEVSGGGTTTGDRITAMNDWNGKQNATNQLTHSECNTNAYAPGFCASYSRVNANSRGLTAGRWWLPSLGELLMICANMTKINYALSLINGATQLAGTRYWSSTEFSQTYAWYCYLNDGILGNLPKATNGGWVRPVSAFLN